MEVGWGHFHGLDLLHGLQWFAVLSSTCELLSTTSSCSSPVWSSCLGLLVGLNPITISFDSPSSMGSQYVGSQNLILFLPPVLISSSILSLHSCLGLSGVIRVSPPNALSSGIRLWPHYIHLFKLFLPEPRFRIPTASLHSLYRGLGSIESIVASTLGFLPPCALTQ